MSTTIMPVLPRQADVYPKEEWGWRGIVEPGLFGAPPGTGGVVPDPDPAPPPEDEEEVDLDGDGLIDNIITSIGNLFITRDDDSINIDIDGDGVADIVIPTA